MKTENAGVNRRQFLGASLAASATLVKSRSVLGANDRISVGLIGHGRRGLLREVLQFTDVANAEVTAVCDTWRQKREEAAAMVREKGGKNPRQIVNYEDLMARDDVDAVIIGTPDHQHCTQLIAAARSGKDAYVEKPLAMNMAELNEAFDAVKENDCLVQIGTQMRSHSTSSGAKQFVQAGKLGQVLKIEQARNSGTPYWKGYGGEEYFKRSISASDVDWKAFLMNRDDRPFSADQYKNWYGFREYSRGPHTNLMVHFIDLVHYVTGATYPVRVVALGGEYRWNDKYTCPDSVEVILEYPEDFLVRYCTTFGNGANRYAKFIGTHGSIDARNLSGREAWIASGEGSPEEDRLPDEVQVPKVEKDHHMLNWLKCIRSREVPIAPIEAGYSHSIATIMADLSLTTGERMIYDPVKKEVVQG